MIHKLIIVSIQYCCKFRLKSFKQPFIVIINFITPLELPNYQRLSTHSNAKLFHMTDYYCGIIWGSVYIQAFQIGKAFSPCNNAKLVIFSQIKTHRLQTGIPKVRIRRTTRRSNRSLFGRMVMWCCSPIIGEYSLKTFAPQSSCALLSFLEI